MRTYEENETFRLICWKCVRNRGERTACFRDTCHDGIKYLPRVVQDPDGTSWDIGGLYACGGACWTWLKKVARERGLQTREIKVYTTAGYQKFSEASWMAATRFSHDFINMVCDNEHAAQVTKAKKRKKNAKKRARASAVQNDSPASASAAASAVLAVPTPPPPPPMVTPSQQSPQPSQRLWNLPAEPATNMAKHYLKLVKLTLKKMRDNVDGYANGTHYSGGTCDRTAAVGMRCMVNHVEGKLELLEKELH